MKKFIFLLVIPFFLFGCNADQQTDLSASTIQTKTEETPETLHQKAILKTNLGDIEIQLFHNKVPTIARNFDLLAQNDFYDNTIFHRVIKGFMIQGGDFENFNGTGGHAFDTATIPDEIAPGLSHTRGIVSMANRGPDTNGSQFFIVHEDSQFLDGSYSIFGQVRKGMDIVDTIADMKTDPRDKPLEEVVILDIILE